MKRGCELIHLSSDVASKKHYLFSRVWYAILIIPSVVRPRILVQLHLIRYRSPVTYSAASFLHQRIIIEEIYFSLFYVSCRDIRISNDNDLKKISVSN